MSFQADRKRYTGALSDINVTPLVDVTLVLLIIFMIAAPVVLQGLETDLPRTEIGDAVLSSDQLVVTLTAERALFINNEPASRETIIGRIRDLLAASPRKYIYLRADKSLVYGEVVNILELIKRAGVTDVALVTEQGQER